MDGTNSPAHAPGAEPHELREAWNRVVGRRAFLMGVGMAGASAMSGGALFAADAGADTAPTSGDVAILRFLAAAELL